MARLILKAPYYKPSNPSRGGYIDYIATREGVEPLIARGGMASYIGERRGSHGLFSDEGKAINISKVVDEVNNHTGNVWGLILSLRREDAERYGYNSAVQWMDLIRSHRNDIARAMHISPENFIWYAAFHQKEEHPHVHIMAWSVKPGEPYLSRKGIEKIKQTFASDIFRQELFTIYSRQTAARDRIRKEYRDRMDELVKAADAAAPSNDLALILQNLALRIRKNKGKKVYGYLSKDQKKAVNDIVRLLSKDPIIAEQYDLWYRLQCEKYRTYTDAMPQKSPIEDEKEMRPIRNSVVRAAVLLGREMDEDGKKSAKTVKETPLQNKTVHPGALRLASTLLRFSAGTMRSTAPKFTESEDYDDIDRQLKREIRQVKNGEPVMAM